MSFILTKLKSIVLFIIGIVRRAFCCFRGRRKSCNNDDECLTHVGVIPNRNEDQVGWSNEWGEDVKRKPQTIQDHIQLYREKVAQPSSPQADPSEEMLDNIFQEMTPQYVKQKRILISNNKSQCNAPDLSRLDVSNNVGGLGDLNEWIEESQSGWDEQSVDPMDVLKEQRRLKRESKTPSSLGRKLKT